MRDAVIVCLHDVCPDEADALRAILDRLEPLVGDRIAAAVIPQPHGRSWDWKVLIQEVKERCDEQMLHGLTHQRPRSLDPLSLLSGRSDELAGLDRDEAGRRLNLGQELMTERFGRPAAGLVPPAWRRGPVDRALLRRCGIGYVMDLWGIETVERRAIPLATWSWDWGVAGAAGRWGAALGHVLARRRGAVPCVVFHPADLRRGLLDRGLIRLEGLLARGCRPVLPSELVESRRDWAKHRL